MCAAKKWLSFGEYAKRNTLSCEPKISPASTIMKSWTLKISVRTCRNHTLSITNRSCFYNYENLNTKNWRENLSKWYIEHPKLALLLQLWNFEHQKLAWEPCSLIFFFYSKRLAALAITVVSININYKIINNNNY